MSSRLLIPGYCLLMLYGVASAANLTVTRGDDPIADGCQPGDCSLREAVIQANSTTETDTILFDVGVIELTLPGTGDDNSLVGDLDVHESLILNALPAGVTIDSKGIDRVFDVMPGTEMTLQGVTVTGGDAVDGGGGLRVVNASLTLATSTVTDNDGGVGDGGGVLCLNGSLTLEQSTITQNQATTGGGIAISGCDLNATESLLDNNMAIALGGGMSLFSGTATWSGGRIGSDLGNQAPSGGGVYASGNFVFSDVRIEHNTASEQGGGLLQDGGDSRITGSLIKDNSSMLTGGGISLVGFATLEITHSLVEGNSAPGGGGMNIRGDLTLRNSTMTSNSASQGGAIALQDDGTLEAEHITISSNSATFGTALLSLTVMTNIDMSNSIVHGSCVYDASVMNSLGGNVESPSDSCHFGSGMNDLVNVNIFSLRLFELANYGGPTHTHAIGRGSVARDNSVCQGACELLDQRYFDRFDGQPDSGAYEFGTGPIFMDSFEDD